MVKAPDLYSNPMVLGALAIAKEGERLKELNAELVTALELISQIQRDKCETASAEMLFILLDNKVDIANAALAKAKEPSDG